MEKITKDNICGVINSGEISSSFISSVKDKVYDEYRELGKESTNDFIDNDTKEEIKKDLEIFGVGTDIIKDTISNASSVALANEIKNGEKTLKEYLKSFFIPHESFSFNISDNNTANQLNEMLMQIKSHDEKGANIGLHYNYNKDDGAFTFNVTENYSPYEIKKLINDNIKNSDQNFCNNINIGITEGLNIYNDNNKNYNNVSKWTNSLGYNNLNQAEVLKSYLGLTDKEFNRIMGQDIFAPTIDVNGNIIKHNDLFYYTQDDNISAIHEFEVDCAILEKIYNSELRGLDGKLLFESLEMKDLNNNKLDFKNINLKSFKMLDSVNFFDKNDNKKSFIKQIAKINETKKKIPKLKNGNNLKKLLNRITFMETYEKEFAEYTEVLKPIKAANKLKNISTKGIEAGYKLWHITNRLKETSKYNKALKRVLRLRKDINCSPIKLKKAEESLERATKALQKKIGIHSKNETVLNSILHPIKAINKKLLEKTKNTAIAKGLSRFRDKITLKSARNRLKSLLDKHLWLPIGNVLNKPLLLILKIIKIVVATIGGSLGIILIIFILGLTVFSSSSAEQAIVTMPFAGDDLLENIQKEYNTLDTQFLSSIEDKFVNYADTTNLKGEKIYYGVNGLNNEDGMKNDDYKNGLHYNYIVEDEKNKGRTSNIEDLLAMTSIITSQQMEDYNEETLKIMEWLYNLSHQYYYTERQLYACNSACHNIVYHCYDHFHDYLDTDIKYNPFHAIKKSGGEYEILKATKKCEVCSQFFNNDTVPKFTGNGHSDNCVILNIENPIPENYYGCVSNETCFHGEDGYLGRGRYCSYCSSYTVVPDCQYDGENPDTHTCGNNCYYIECNGHSHYTCNTHNYKCCLGHTDILANINIKFYNELKDIVNRYKFSDNDWVYEKLKNEEGNIYETEKEEEFE